MVQNYIQKTIRGTVKASPTIPMNIVKQGSGINHLPLLRAFKPPSKMLAMLSYTLYFLMSY